MFDSQVILGGLSSGKVRFNSGQNAQNTSTNIFDNTDDSDDNIHHLNTIIT